MKRIKCEEIQKSIQNYVKQRNISSGSFLINRTTQNPIDNVIDLNLMAVNDLALIESSINDYYSFSFNSSSETEYFSQFEK